MYKKALRALENDSPNSGATEKTPNRLFCEVVMFLLIHVFQQRISDNEKNMELRLTYVEHLLAVLNFVSSRLLMACSDIEPRDPVFYSRQHTWTDLGDTHQPASSPSAVDNAL